MTVCWDVFPPEKPLKAASRTIKSMVLMYFESFNLLITLNDFSLFVFSFFISINPASTIFPSLLNA